MVASRMHPIAVVASTLQLFHYLVVGLNFRLAFRKGGTAFKFIRIGVVAYLAVGALQFLTAFRGVAVETQFTFLSTAIEQLGIYGGVSMMFFGAIYYMVPRLTGAAWASPGLTAGHRVLVASLRPDGCARRGTRPALRGGVFGG